MKTYKINGKEIQGIPIKHNELMVYQTVNELLEALSDKEEDKFSPTEELLKMCNKGYIGGELEHEIYKPDEPLLKPKKEDCDECDGSGFMIDQEGDYNTPCKSDRHKQPTSLKEDRNSLKYQISYLLWNENNFTKEETDRYSDRILKLIQSHIVKEVETLEPAKYIKSHNECADGYAFAKEDIIKIINNIC